MPAAGHVCCIQEVCLCAVGGCSIACDKVLLSGPVDLCLSNVPTDCSGRCFTV